MYVLWLNFIPGLNFPIVLRSLSNITIPPPKREIKFKPRKKLNHKTEGHFACVCVHPLNDNSVGASNLMAENRKLA